MAVFRVERNSGYTVMSNHHLRNKELTLKAKGLLSQMLSLPEDWDYARGQHLTNIRHYIDDDESGRFFDRSAYSRMMDDVENGKIGVCIMKDLTRWGRDYLQVGNAMEIFRRNKVRFIAVNNGIDSEKPDTLEFAPFINIMFMMLRKGANSLLFWSSLSTPLAMATKWTPCCRKNTSV